MAVDDHGLEVLKKSGEEVVPGSKADYYLKVGPTPGRPLVVTFDPDMHDPQIFNLSVPLADTEVSQALPSSTKRFLVRARGKSRVQFSFNSGDSGSNFITISPGAVYSEDNLRLTSLTLYLQTSLANEVVEVLTWS